MTCLAEEEITAVEAAIRALPTGQEEALKPVFDHFAGKYDYNLLRCVRAHVRSRDN